MGPLGLDDVRPLEAQLKRTVTVDLSQGGACLYSEGRYAIGTQLFCAITLPGQPRRFEVVGTLAWYQKVDREERGYKLGLEFAQMTAEHQALLAQFLAHPPASAASRAKTLLLVEDDEELQLAMKLRFESAGFHVITASEGLEALRKGREEHPHLIILDLMLPNLNGYEVCRLLKFDHTFHDIPIILCTARCRREDMEMGKAVGADAFVTKPFNGQELIEKVETLLTVHPG